MKNSVIIHLLVLVICFNFNFSEAQGGMLKEVPLKRQIKASKLIVEGKVIAQKTVWDDQRTGIYTVHTVQVYKEFKGKAANFVDVVTQGGRVGDVEQVIFPNLHLELNTTGIFTLFDTDPCLQNLSHSNTSYSKYTIYSSLQGFYKHDLQRDEVSSGRGKTNSSSKAFYNKLQTYTNRPVVDIQELPSARNLSTNKALFAAPEDVRFSPSNITAGALTQLTINGSDFGSTIGSVGFRNADSGGLDSSGNPNYREALNSQIISWANTEIRVRVPYWAGTGDVRVTKSDGTQGVSSLELVIDTAIINDNEGRRTQHVSLNDTGNITLQFNTAFNANSLAKSAFLRALDAWRCETRINLEVESNSSSIARSASDGVNIVTFDAAANPLPEGVLGLTNYFIAFCGGERGAVTEIDMVFNDNLNDPSTPAAESWYFGEDPRNISFEQWDFQSVELHELGHAHQLGHVVDTDDAMHFAISNFEIQRGLNSNNITAAQSVQSLGTTALVCGFSRMTNYSGACVLNDVVFEGIENAIEVYPNPAKNQFFVTNCVTLNLEYVTLHDLSGRMVKKVNFSGASNTQAIEVQGLNSGVYIVGIHSGQISKSIKLVVN